MSMTNDELHALVQHYEVHIAQLTVQNERLTAKIEGVRTLVATMEGLTETDKRLTHDAIRLTGGHGTAALLDTKAWM